MPPDAVTGVNEAALPAVKVVLGTACVVVSGVTFTVRPKVLDEVCAVGVVWSVTVTVKVVVARADVGVPLIWPVVVEKFSPVGKVPPDSAKLNVPVPPEAVTGINGVAALPAVKVVLGTACVVVSGVTFTVKLKVLDEVCAVGVVWSVTVTVKIVVASADVAVPLICPVEVEKVRPVGSVPPDSA